MKTEGHAKLTWRLFFICAEDLVTRNYEIHYTFCRRNLDSQMRYGSIYWFRPCETPAMFCHGKQFTYFEFYVTATSLGKLTYDYCLFLSRASKCSEVACSR